MGSLVQEMQQVVDKNLKLPQGYTVTWGGEFENQQRAMGRLIMIIPVSVLLIFVLLFEAFKTVKSAALILLNVPFALIGGILALYLTGIHLSVSAAIGFIALFGQAVLNGVVMVSYFDQLQEEGLAPYERGLRRRANAASNRADDFTARHAGTSADGAFPWHGLGSAAAAGGRNHWRTGLGDDPDADCAAGSVPDAPCRSGHGRTMTLMKRLLLCICDRVVTGSLPRPPAR